MNFVLKHYRKGASIQLKPQEDISIDPARCVHFSVAWFKDVDISKEEQRLATAQLFARLSLLIAKQNRLTFTVVKPCENCSYGHLDGEFETIVQEARQQFPFCIEKNLPLDK